MSDEQDIASYILGRPARSRDDALANPTPPDSEPLLEARLLQSIGRMRGDAERLSPNSPIRPLLNGIGEVLDALADVVGPMSRQIESHADRVQGEMEAAIQVAMLRTMEREAELVERIADRIAARADALIIRRARHWDWMIAITVGGALAVSILVAGFTGYAAGRQVSTAPPHLPVMRTDALTVSPLGFGSRL